MLGIVGAILILVGWIWLIFTGFTKGGVVWGIVTLLFSWIGGLIFFFVKKEGLTPTLVIIGGIVLTIIGRMM